MRAARGGSTACSGARSTSRTGPPSCSARSRSGRLRPMVKDLSSDGLLQRFMPIFPAQITPDDPDDDDRAPDKKAIDAYEKLIVGLRALRPPARDGGGFLEVWAGANSKPVRRQLFTLIERIERDPALPAPLKETVAKWRGLLARLALVFHCVRVAEAKTSQTSPTPHDKWDEIHFTSEVELLPSILEMAANFIRRVVAPSTFRFYRELGLDGDPNARWIAGFILARGLTKLSARDIGRAYRELRGDLPGIVRAMELLEHAGWVAGDGHPKRPTWDVNPLVHQHFLAKAEAERQRREREMELLRQSVTELAGTKRPKRHSRARNEPETEARPEKEEREEAGRTNFSSRARVTNGTKSAHQAHNTEITQPEDVTPRFVPTWAWQE